MKDRNSSVIMKNQTMDCGPQCQQGENLTDSSEDEFQVLGSGRYQMTMDNPKDMENLWRYCFCIELSFS